MPQKHHDDTLALGVMLAVVSSICFSIQGIVIKLAFVDELSVPQILFWRKLFFLPPLALYAFYVLRPEKIFVGKRSILISIITGIVGYIVVPYFSFEGLHEVGAGIERVLIYTFPIFVILINAALERKLPEAKHIFSFFIIQAGIFLLIGGANSLEILKSNLKGSLMVMVAAFSMGIFVILMQTVVRRIGTLCFMLWATVGATITAFIMFFPHRENLSAHQYLMIAIISYISFLPGMLFSEAVKRIGGNRGSLITSAGPILTFIFAYMILGEVMSPLQIIGGIIIILCIIIMERQAFSVFIKWGRAFANKKENAE